MPDIGIPIAFPDYKISVYGRGIPGLGHAGVLIIKQSGFSLYYEYGRYRQFGSLGGVRKVAIADVKMGKDDHPTHASLLKTIAQISAKAGHGGRILGGYISAPGKFKTMQGYIMKRFAENRKPKRDPYALLSNSCMTFAKSTIESAKISMPSGTIPSPADWIEDVQDRYPDLVYEKNKLSIDFIKGEENHVPQWATQKSWVQGKWDGDVVTKR